MAKWNPEELNRQYSARDRVPDFQQHFDRWASESKKARETTECVLDVAYGSSPGETLDVFPASRAMSQVLVFIHGGYWRSLDKSDHSFIAPPFVEGGACVVVPNYDLCPKVTIPDICVQVARAVAWTWKHAPDHGGDPRQITVMGHSAGGHLAAMMLTCDWPRLDADLPADVVSKALAISGLYDLEPIMNAPFLQESLHLTPADVRRASPVNLPAPAGKTLYTVAGGEESQEFLRQNQLLRERWGEQVVEVCDEAVGENHFSILAKLVEPGHALQHLAQELLWR